MNRMKELEFQRGFSSSAFLSTIFLFFLNGRARSVPAVMEPMPQPFAPSKDEEDLRFIDQSADYINYSQFDSRAAIIIHCLSDFLSYLAVKNISKSRLPSYYNDFISSFCRTPGLSRIKPNSRGVTLILQSERAEWRKDLGRISWTRRDNLNSAYRMRYDVNQELIKLKRLIISSHLRARDIKDFADFLSLGWLKPQYFEFWIKLVSNLDGFLLFDYEKNSFFKDFNPTLLSKRHNLDLFRQFSELVVKNRSDG